MSKSKRVFLTIMGDEDFWGNGDRKNGGKNNNIIQEIGEKQLKDQIEKKMYYESAGEDSSYEGGLEMKKIRNISESSDDLLIGMKTLKTYSDDENVESKDSEEYKINEYQKFLQNRPDSEIRVLFDGPFDILHDTFFEIYHQIRDSFTLADCEENIVIQQLQRNTQSIVEHHSQTKHAVVVSSFREPDRRLGRFSKYYYHHNVGPEVYSRKVFVGGLPACVTELEILSFFSRFGRLQVDWPSKNSMYSTYDSDPSLGSSESQIAFNQPNQQLYQHTNSPLHFSSLSSQFGQINPFVTDYSDFSRGSGQSLPSMSCGMVDDKRQKHLGYVFLLFEKEKSVRDLVTECCEEEAGLFISLDDCRSVSNRVQIRPWLLADAEFLMDFNVPINTKLVAFIGGVPRPLKAVELAHFFEQTYGNVVCVGIDIDNKFKYPRGSGRVAFSNYEAYVNAITDRYIVLDHEDIHKRVEIKPYFFHNQSCEECSGRYHRQHAPFFCPSLECFQYYCEPCWHKMHSHPSRFHHMPVIKGV
uniref:CPB-2 n=1 Tax=Caenorhabditis angaria TaxID=860376 RepID=Q6E3E7_9PELO|nr:CPB-2 [Caenorhabditis angaria]AAT72454.1 CPB-2 [Caenorhabditis angaria]